MDLDTQMKERLVEYRAFLNELSMQEGVADADAEKLRRLATFIFPDEDEVEAEDEDAAGLNRWSVRNWGRRPRQTGMEQQNEKVVLDLINLFAGYEIPFYIRDGRGEKTGKEYSTLQRLGMLREKFAGVIATAKAARQRAEAAAELIEQHRLAHAAVLAELAGDVETNPAAARARVILTNVEETKETVRYGDPDDRGVRRVTLDARALVLRLCMQRIVHDLAANEQICRRCLGLGLIKLSAPYVLGKQKPHENAFPYFDEWLSDCPECYLGKTVHCDLCKAALPRTRTVCECAAAQAERARAADADLIVEVPRG